MTETTDAAADASTAAADTPPTADDDEPTGGGTRYWPAAGMAVLFLATVAGGLAFAGPFRDAGLQQFDDPTSLGNTGLIVAEILVFTAIFLVALRYDRGEQLVRLLVIVAFAAMFHYPARLLLPETAPVWAALAVGGIGGALLWTYPEWYVLDAAAVLGGAVIVGLFGVSLSVLPVLALLTVLAAYDAYSVYASEHMQSVAGGVLDLEVPMVFVVPDSWSFSLRDIDDLETAAGEAMFLGVGDAAIPGLLAVSADTFLSTPPVVLGLGAPALGATVGAVVGLAGLFVLLFRIQRTHAGLPVLNGCVIAGYLLGAAVAGVPLESALGIADYL